MNQTTLALAVSALSVVLHGCGGNSETQEGGTDEPSSGGLGKPEQPATNFMELHSGDYPSSGLYNKKSVHIYDAQQSYENALLLYSYEDPVEVDFSTSRVLLLDMGQQDSGGYGIEVTSVQEGGDGAAIVEVDFLTPGEDCSVTAALTNPYQFVEVRTTGEIAVRENIVVAPCEP